jgi:symplekin
MAANLDPLQTLSAAIAASTPDQQAELLATLRESLEAQPAPIPILCTTLFSKLVGPGESLLKTWFLDLLHFAICRSTLTLEVRTQC